MLALTLLSCAGLVSACLFISFPGLDIAAASLFYLGDGQFIGTWHPIVIFMKKAISDAALHCAGLTLVGVLVSGYRRSTFLGFTPRRLRFLFYCQLFGPGLLVNWVLKNHWGRARPEQTDLFGGLHAFTPALMVTDQCDSNCSFVSGDVSFAFFLLAFVFLAPPPRRRMVAAVVAFGTFVGIVRMSDGSHYLSDVVFAGIFTSMVVSAARLLVLQNAGGYEAWLNRRVRSLVGGARAALLQRLRGRHAFRSARIGMTGRGRAA